MGLRRAIVLLCALGAALAVSTVTRAAPEATVRVSSDAAEAKAAAHSIRLAIGAEADALVPLRHGGEGDSEGNLRKSEAALRAAEAFAPVGSDLGLAMKIDEQTHAEINAHNFEEAIRGITIALGVKHEALALAEADMAANSVGSSTAKPGECHLFDPDLVFKGAEDTIAVDGCDPAKIWVEDETPGVKLMGHWGVETGAGLKAGTCGFERVLLDCTLPPGASAAVVVLSTPLAPGSNTKIVLKLGDGSTQTVQYHAPGGTTKPATTTTTEPPAPGKVVKLEVKLSCLGVVSAPISVTNPANATPVIYVAHFKPHGFCGGNSQSLIDVATGKQLPPGAVIFPPNTTVVADQYTCAKHPKLDGCQGQGADSQTFVFGITVTNPKP